jgi:hypothetical protein
MFLSHFVRVGKQTFHGRQLLAGTNAGRAASEVRADKNETSPARHAEPCAL